LAWGTNSRRILVSRVSLVMASGLAATTRWPSSASTTAWRPRRPWAATWAVSETGLRSKLVRVTATDVSTAMLHVTERKACECGVSDLIDTRALDLACPPLLTADVVLSGESVGARYDGALSNFGGLNCVNDLRPLAAFLADVIRPHGTVIVVPMNRWCAWEIVWHLLHAQPRTAFRRLRRDGVEAQIGANRVQVWYPSIATLQQIFAPQFHPKRVTGLGVCLPPSYFEPVLAKRPALFRRLQRLDQLMRDRWLFSRLADHVILELERAA